MKKEYIIILFLLLSPILDVTNFLGFPFSILLRGIFLIGSIIYLIYNKQELKILISLLVFGIIVFFYQYLYLNFGITSSISAVLKFLYLPISIMFFKNYLFPIKKEKILGIILLSYVGIYLLSYIFNIGGDIYLEEQLKKGFKGLFSSINEFSAILVCLLPIVANYLKQNKRFVLLVILFILTFLCSLLIGTKILMGGIVFSILYLMWQERGLLFFKRSRFTKIIIVVTFVIIILIGSILFTKTITYQNMIVQQNFFKVNNVFSLEFVNKVVYNDRLTFLQENFDYFRNQNIIKILFGIGMEDYNIKMVEIDIFDIIFRYGILGMIVFIGTIGLLLNFNEIEKVEKISIILLIIISLTSGHVLIYPAVSIYFGILLSNNKKSLDENQLQSIQ